MNRATTSIGIDGARPPISRPMANRPRPTANGTASPPRSISAADDDDADQRAEEERREDPAVQLEAAELVGDDRHDRRDGQRLEADERDGQDQPERQCAPVGTPQAVGLVLVAGRCIRTGWRNHGGARAATGPPRPGRRQAGCHSPSAARQRSTAAACPSPISTEQRPPRRPAITGSATERRSVAAGATARITATIARLEDTSRAANTPPARTTVGCEPGQAQPPDDRPGHRHELVGLPSMIDRATASPAAAADEDDRR